MYNWEDRCTNVSGVIMLGWISDHLSREFIDDVRISVERRDLVLVSLVPVVLTLVVLLPQRVQVGLALDYGSPTLVMRFMSAYVHAGYGHYINNLMAYVVLVVPTYLLCALSGKRRVFWSVFLVFVLVLPFVLSAFDLWLLDAKIGRGFSGVDGAFLGFLPVALVVFLRERYSGRIRVVHSTSLFMFTATYIAYTYSGWSKTALATLGLFLLALLYVVYSVGWDELGFICRSLARPKGYFELVLTSLLFFVLYSLLVFPADITGEESVVNILSHYIGFSFGFLIPHTYLNIQQIRDR